MITFNEKEKTFLITNKSIALFLYINEMKQIETVYFGVYKEDISLKYRKEFEDNYSTSYFDTCKNEFIDHSDKSSNEHSLFEISGHDVGDHRPAPIIIRHADGSVATNFLYDSFSVSKGYPSYVDMPHATGEDVDTLTFILRDEFDPNIVLKYNISINNNHDVLIKNFEIENHSKNPINLLKALSLHVDLDSKDFDVHHFGGAWGYERNEFVNHVIDGEQIISSCYGRSSHEENPFFFLTNKNIAIGFNLIYSGNFKASIFTDYSFSTRITYGINDYDFDWVIEPNGLFVTPQASICYSGTGVDNMSQHFHRFINENLIQYKLNKRPIIFNCWEGCEMNFTTESIISYMKDAREIGSELFVLDDGWFSLRNDVMHGLGDWSVNKSKIDLKKVISYCHDIGMKFGLWFEPEMINYDVPIFKKHPEYVLGLDRAKATVHRSQFVLDFSNPEVVDLIYSQMIEVLDNHNIDYIKWDHNRDIKEANSLNLSKEHKQEFYHRYVMGYYSLLSRLRNRYPHMMIEGCASGGGRFDLGTLYYAPLIWTSDNTSASARMNIQYNTSFAYPLGTISSHVSKASDSSYETKSQLALFGSFGFEMNPNMLTDIEKEVLSKYSLLYKKKHNEIFIKGNLYHLSSSVDGLRIYEVISKDKTEAYILLIYYSDIALNSVNVLPCGLDESFNYKIDMPNIENNGKNLMNDGFLVEINKDSKFKISSVFINIIKK